MPTAQRVLDQAYTRDRFLALAAEPGAYLVALAEEVEAQDELEVRDAALAAALGQVDAATVRGAKLLMEHALAGEPSLAAPTRNVFASTVVGYAADLTLLARRAHDVAARGGARDAAAVAETVVAAARTALELRATLRAGVLALTARLAAAAVPIADAFARDRRTDEPVRRRWSAARRELEALAADPARIAAAPIATRLAAYPAQLDDPPAEAEPRPADLIELD